MSMTLHRMIDQAASRRPEAEAIRCGGEALTYGELAGRSNGLSRVLVQTGLRRGDRVAVLVNKGFRVPVGFYGAFAAGGVLVPIDPKSPADQVIRILRATGATHLVSENGKRQLVDQAAAECPEIRHVIGVDPGEVTSFECHPWEEVEDAADSRPLDVSVIDLDPCYILHTSGSTGMPKLILHTHRSAMSFVDWAVSEYGLTPLDRLSNHSSPHTCFATFDYYAAARVGAATVILTPAMLMMPGSLSKHIEEERISVWYSVPTALVQLSLRGDLESRDLNALRWILFAGETFPEKHLQRIMRQLPGACFSHVYGSTEINVVTFYHLPAASQLRSPLPIGRACSNASTEVVDADLNEVPDGDEGELIVRGGTIMSGYWGDPDRNDEALIQRSMGGDPNEVFFRTGDRVRRLPDGNLTFVARADLQIKVRGHRVELEAVESALLSLEPVEEAAAFTVPDGEGSQRIRSAVVVGAGAEVGERELLADLKRILPGHAIPDHVAFLQGLPRTPTGKVDRKALKRCIEGPEENDNA